MTAFIDRPNLPDRDVRLCAVSRYPVYIHRALTQMGIGTVIIEKNPRLPKPVASHGDLQLLHLGINRIALEAGNRELSQSLQKQGFQTCFIAQPLSNCYPGDCLLNGLILGGHLYAGAAIDKVILEACGSQAISYIPVKQGYTRCSVCLVSEGAAITADIALAAILRKQGVDVLLIKPGAIELAGYSYGFIGGCAGLVGKNKLVFTGSLKKHPEGNRIYRFCNDKGLTAICLSDEGLVDIGGIIPLLQAAE